MKKRTPFDNLGPAEFEQWAGEFLASRAVHALANPTPVGSTATRDPVYEELLSERLHDARSPATPRTGTGAPAGFFFRTLQAGSATKGKELVFEAPEYRGNPGNRSVVEEMGATFLEPDSTNIRLVKEPQEVEVQYLQESVASTGASGAIGADKMPLRTIHARTTFSRLLAASASTSLPARRVVDDRLRSAAFRSIDHAALVGSGEDGQPLGILNRPGIQVVEIGDNGGTPTYDQVVDLEAKCGDVTGPSGFVAHPLLRRVIRKVPRLANAGAGPTWSGDFMLGHRALASSWIPTGVTKGTSDDTSPLLYSADWSHLYVAVYGVDLLVNPVTGMAQGDVTVELFLHVGIGCSAEFKFGILEDGRAAAFPVDDSAS